MKKTQAILLSLGAMAGVFLPFVSVSAAISPELQEVYATRGDLQAAFRADNYQAIPGTAAGFLIDLEDWARQYGWSAYPELAEYAPVVEGPQQKNGVLEPEILSENYIIIDDASGTILAARGADIVWPMASITKLTTVITVLEQGIDPYSYGEILEEDEVGGARLYVFPGTQFLVKDLLYATLVGSTNNGANALARLTGLEKTVFVQKMNAFAERLNLPNTHFVDPTGIEVENYSTAREIAYIAREVFREEAVRRIAGTAFMHIASKDESYERDILSTNRLLYDARFDDVYVTAGKTGFLYESKWNLLVQMHPMGEDMTRSVTIVMLGAPSRDQSFLDAHGLAHWAWNSFEW